MRSRRKDWKLVFWTLKDAVDLLCLRSRIQLVNESPQAKAKAERIVQELGYLPLAIEQAPPI